MAFNKVILMGNLTRDIELRTTTSGQSVANFTIAVSRVWKDKSGERQEDTAFVDCEAWGSFGEMLSKYFSKGNPILVSGRLCQDTWEDKDTGKNRSTLRVVVEDFSFVGNKGEASASSKPANSDNNIVEDVDSEVDLSDIPF